MKIIRPTARDSSKHAKYVVVIFDILLSERHELFISSDQFSGKKTFKYISSSSRTKSKLITFILIIHQECVMNALWHQIIL